MLDFLYAVLAVLFVFGVAINIHEFGHYIVGKILGMRIEAYSFFGLGPRVWGFKRGHTDYRISAIPLGAYVKFYGDEGTSALEGGSSKPMTEEELKVWMEQRNIGSDEDGRSLAEKEALDQIVPDSELFELRPRWQKFLVMVGGPFMNIVLALAVPFGMALTYGVPSNPPPIVGYVKAGGAAEKAGIKVGDKIVNFEGIENPTFERVNDEAMLIPEKEVPIAVQRSGERLTLKITPTKITEQGQSAGFLDFDADKGVEAVVVGSLNSEMPAATSGLEIGDTITSVNGVEIRNTQEMKRMVGEIKDQPINLAIKRRNETKNITTSAVKRENGDWLIGIGFDPNFSTNKEAVGIVGAASHALNTNLKFLRMTGKAFGQVSTGERSARDTVSGPIGIVKVIKDMAFSAGFPGLLFLLGLISLNLGIMNLLPIPMLDGGQIMMLGVEKVYSWFGKTVSMVIRERVQLVGLAMILLLMVFTLFNDVSKFFK
jgi:regulator of sigma E protease